MKRLGVLALAVFVCGCNGGSGAPVAQETTPVPTPTLTPTPTPTPTAGVSQATLLTLNIDTALEGFAGSNLFDQDQSGRIVSAPDYSITSGSPVNYIAAQRSFKFTSFDTLIDGIGLGDAPLYRDSATSTSAFSEYRGQSGPVTYRLTQLTPGSSNSLLPLLYSSVAVARATTFDNASGVTKYGITPMSFGTLFDWDRTKLTGSANYRGVIIGHGRGLGSRTYDISGSFEMALNYDTTALSGRIKLIGTDARRQTFELGTFELLQSVKRGVLDYFYADTTNDGQLQSRLAGFNGQEIIGGYDVKIPDPATPEAMLTISVALAGRR